MALQRKIYRCSKNRSRGGIKGKDLDTSSSITGNTPKNYDQQMKAHWGGRLEETQKELVAALRLRGLRV